MLFARESKYYEGATNNYIYLEPNDIIYDEENIFRCPDCNNIKFYIDDEFIHKCPINNKETKITFDIIQNKENNFKINVNHIKKVINIKKNFYYFIKMIIIIVVNV